jgi:hypothetical protein
MLGDELFREIENRKDPNIVCIKNSTINMSDVDHFSSVLK